MLNLVDVTQESNIYGDSCSPSYNDCSPDDSCSPDYSSCSPNDVSFP